MNYRNLALLFSFVLIASHLRAHGLPPFNDEASAAIGLEVNTVCVGARGTLSGATASAGVPGGCTGTADDDVWFRFSALKPNPTISLSNLAAAITSTGGGARMQLFSGTPGSLVSIGCGTTTLTASGLATGATYYVRVYSANNTALSGASFDICVTDPAPAPVVDSTTILFDLDTVATQLGFPWEITQGPDDSLWITEARGYRVVRVSKGRTNADRARAPQQVLKIPLASSLVSFGRNVGTWPQGGMEGLVIHPEFMSDPAKRWVYLAYVYSGTCPSSPSSPCYFRSKIVRCRFYFSSDAGNPTSLPKRDTLVILDTLISNLPGSNDHNSGRLAMGPVKEGPDNTYKLYFTIGDMGAGQFNNAGRTNHAQNRDTCEGKILRLNTEPDGDGVPGSAIHDYDRWRQWIPNDNPFLHSVNGLRTPVYSYGHRNAQGLAWGNTAGTWRLYSSEHGDKSDDEINIIEAGRNYGWPRIAGYADNNYTTSDNSTNGYTKNDQLASVTITSETGSLASMPDFQEPAFSFFPWNGARIETINTGNIFTWPTIAPSGLEYYGVGTIPGWQHSLLVPSLKYGLFRLKLNPAGDGILDYSGLTAVDTFPLLHGWRVRDLALSDDGGTIWAVIDSSGSTSGPTGGFGGSNGSTRDGGKVLRLRVKSPIVLAPGLLRFDARLVYGRQADLSWVLAAAARYEKVIVERAGESGFFTLLAELPAARTAFRDETPLYGLNRYRLRLIDAQGQADYSEIRILRYRPPVVLNLSPNPARQVLRLRITLPEAVALRLAVQDISGRIVFTRMLPASGPVVSMQLDPGSWPAGLYWVRLVDEEGRFLASGTFLRQ